jgi:hypothetical protein
MNHNVRTRDSETKTIENYTRGMAIKVMCTECLGWEEHPKDCTSPLCPLFPYRKKTMATQNSKISDQIDEETDEDESLCVDDK